MDSAASLPPEQAASYTVIIDSLLAVADLNTISVKKIRNGLQLQVPYDIKPQKEAIKDLIEKRFDKFLNEQESQAASAIETVERDPEPTVPVARAKTNGHAVVKAEVKEEEEDDDDDEGETQDDDGAGEDENEDGDAEKKKEEAGKHTSVSTIASPVKRRSTTDDIPSYSSPPPKKKRKNIEDLDADAALAARLQAEENARSRPTRGGSVRKAAVVVKKKQPKKKSKDKVSAEDDSDVDGSRPEKKVNRNSGFHKLLSLSPALSVLLGNELQLSRPQATKKLWAYIKANELQDPSDKRTICCDAPMKAVFKTDRINMFAMTKLMSQNMYDAAE